MWPFGKRGERRQFPRRAEKFDVSISYDGGKNLIKCSGLNLGGAGLCLVMPGVPSQPEFQVVITLDKRKMVLRAKVRWKKPTQFSGKPAMMVGMIFTALKADDYDAMMRWVTGQGPVEFGEVGKEALEMHRMSKEDADRLIPKKLADEMLDTLVSLNRLAPLTEHHTPLVQLFYGGMQQQKSGPPLHRLQIISKVVGKEDVKTFETHFQFEPQGKTFKVLR
jgi:hypothetical protein